MRVLIVTMNLPPDNENINGGVSSAVYNLLPGFLKIQNLDLHILSFNQGIRNCIVKRFFDNISLYFEPYRIFGINKIDFVLKSGLLLRRYYNLLKPDIIHYQSHGLFLLMRMTLRKNDVTEIVTFHGLTKRESYYAKNKIDKIVKMLNEIVNYFILPKYAVFVSEFSHLEYRKYNFEKHAIIFNSVSEDFYNVEPKQLNNKVLLYVGHINPLKNLLLLLSAISSLKSENLVFKVLVVGEFSDVQYKGKVLDFISQKKLEDMVIFLGHKRQSELVAILQESDALVVTSRHENLPVVIAEAMASGKVVIASNVGGIPEMIKQSETGYLYKSDNEYALCQILKTLNPQDSYKVGKKAKQFALNNFNSNYNAKRIFRFYGDLLDRI